MSLYHTLDMVTGTKVRRAFQMLSNISLVRKKLRASIIDGNDG